MEFNLNIKNFDDLFAKFCCSDKIKPYWDLACHNFSTNTLYENICKYCLTIKPERGYHCKMCKNCVRRLDHHCFIINKCIGYENYKIFLNMLIYATSTLMVICMAMIETLKFYLNDFYVILIFNFGIFGFLKAFLLFLLNQFLFFFVYFLFCIC